MQTCCQERLSSPLPLFRKLCMSLPSPENDGRDTLCCVLQSLMERRMLLYQPFAPPINIRAFYITTASTTKHTDNREST